MSADTDRGARREKMIRKIQHCLAMARDAGGNANEMENAMRQANAMMAAEGIEEAECDMRIIEAGQMQYGEVQFGADGRAPEKGKVYRAMPSWCGMLAVGVARFSDSVAIRKRTENGEMLAFQGERSDVLLGRWIFGVLVEQIQNEQKASGWTARDEANDFKVAAASTLCHRLRDLAAERRAMFEAAKAQSNSRALMVVDSKALAIRSRFGEQRTRASQGRRASAAGMAGQQAGARINIPAGRPIGQSGGGHARLK